MGTLATTPQPASTGPLGGSTGAKIDDAGEAVQRHSYGFFALIALCFLLPFVAVTCSGTELASLQGLDLAIGGEAEINEDVEQQMEDLGQGLGGEGTLETESASGEEFEMNAFALAALIAAAAGALLMFALKGRARNMAAILCAAVIVAGLILLRFDDQLKVEEQQGDFPGGEIPISLEYKFGYWLALLLAVIVGAVHVLALKDRPRPTPIGRSPEPPPPIGGPPPAP